MICIALSGTALSANSSAACPGMATTIDSCVSRLHVSRRMFVDLILSVGHQFELWCLDLHLGYRLGDGMRDGFGGRLGNCLDARRS